MKRIKKRWIFLGVFLIVLLGTGFWVWNAQQDNLKALQIAVSHTTEQLDTMRQETDQAVQQVTQKLPEASGIQMTDELREQIQKGEITQQEAIDSLLSGNMLQPDTQPEKVESPEQESQQTVKPQEPNVENAEITAAKQRISELVAQVYVLEAYFTSQLTAKEEQVVAEYKALPKEQRTKATKISMALDSFSELSAMEKDCDTQMNAIIAEMRELITVSGGDPTVPDEILAAYKSKKEVQRAQYVEKYAKHLD